MKKYASIANKDTKELNVFAGTETPQNIKWAVETCNMSLMEVEKAEDGRYFLAGYLPGKNLEEEKEKKIKTTKELCQNYIYSKYSLTDQLDIQSLILGYTEQNLNEMKDFIESKVIKCRGIVEEIKGATSLEELDKIKIDFQQD